MKINNVKRVIALISLFMFVSPVTFAWTALPLSIQFYKEVRVRHGASAEQRLHDLQLLLIGLGKSPMLEKLTAINEYFNQVEWRDDMSLWGESDYWQTPLETMLSFKGDCEDIAIAKYTALRMLGVPDHQLAMVYVTITREPEYSGTPHMVLAYYENSDESPLILGNIDTNIALASLRSDLTSVFMFNATNFSATDGHFQKRGSVMPSSGLSKLEKLKDRVILDQKYLLGLNK